MSRIIECNYQKCSCCKKKFSMSFYNKREYVYKVKVGKHYVYQCSYSCYRKEKAKYANSRDAS